ncbi:IS110 family transposase [Hymenobacter volaticus]|uniref:IS110 family transposase n=1 Tax=Hymenobacter volaticus TaxID=2932254 RepID=A0ABY4GG09_9BACT|nr:IS110 family transposase [Hymenobacter volaticus]UOQ69895.1 IS110 family transposase [Hymenobacter volaticus]
MPISRSKFLKYAVGIDIAKDSFVARFGSLDTNLQLQLDKPDDKTFANTQAGFADLLTWVKKLRLARVPLIFVVEATGVYYEELAYFLADHQQSVSVLLPFKVKHFAHSTKQKGKTDKQDARMLCRLGLERHDLPIWTAATSTMRIMRGLYRELDALKHDSTRLKNKLHAYEHTYQPNARTIARLVERQQMLARHIEEVNQELAQLVAKDSELQSKIALLTSVPGVGLATAIAVVSETSGFSLTENERQLASYAGLDVVQKQSGLTSKPSSISRRGNTRLRTALYMAAMSSKRCNPRLKAFFEGLKVRKSNAKAPLIAVMRKLLLLCYALWKKNQAFDPAYKQVQSTTILTIP